MTNEVKNIPELRFPEFSYCWQEKQLGELASVTKLAGFEFTKYVKYSDFGEIPAIRGLNVKNGDFVFSDVKYIDDSDFSKLSRSKLESDNIVYTYVGTIGDAAIVPVNKLWYLAPNVAKIVTKNIEPKFLLQILLDSNFKKKEVLSWISTSSQPALSMTNIRKFKMQIPKSSIEQEKIGDFFSKLDQQIELEEQKLAKLKEQKKGYMQKIFSQELRFKDENGNDYPEWEIKKLMQIAKVKTGSKNVQDNIQDGKYKFFDRSVEVKYLNTFDFDETAIIYPGEGSKFLPRYFSGKYSLHQRAYSIYDININNNYLYYYLSLQNNHFLKYAVGSTVKSLRMSGFDKLKVMVPKNSEQEKIGSFFKNLDEFIEKQANKVELLKQRKQSFLQKMFV